MMTGLLLVHFIIFQLITNILSEKDRFIRCNTVFDAMGACGSRAFSIEDIQELLKNSIVDNVIFKSISENIVSDELKLLLSRMEPLILQKGEVLFEVGEEIGKCVAPF